MQTEIIRVGRGRTKWTHLGVYSRLIRIILGPMLPLKPLQLLPAASFVFRRIVRSYSKLLVNRATRVFEFADKYRGSYSDGLNSVVCPFYCSYSGYQDELLWGAAWLHRATRNSMYLSYVH